MVSGSYLELFDTAAPDAARLGGKATSLVKLVRAGHRVPPGFTITVDAFRAAIDELDLAAAVARVEAAIAGGGDAIGEGKRVQAALLAARIPDRVLRPVLAQVERMRLYDRNERGVIVRSSATVEDSDAFSFAGIFESIRTDRIDELEATIRQVWAALFAPRALSYLSENGMRAIPLIAVVVQRFVPADRSGVMFTRFGAPDGSTRILVEHVEGDCQKLVNGEVIPDRVWLAPDGTDAGGGGALAAEHARELVRLAADLEEMFGGPQDVEWVIAEGAVHLVQSRPITVALAAPAATVAGDAPPILRGVAASPGAGTGPVHLVFNIEQALALSPGQVLVTPMTNPDMVVAMRNSAAIVTDVGGIICHAAIVSRELGLPCVVGTESATSALAAGQVVTVDGSGGAVYDGALAIARPGGAGRPADWSDVWSRWSGERTPLVPTLAALEQAPAQVTRALLAADLDLRCGRDGLWDDLEAAPAAARAARLDDYLAAVSRAAGGRAIEILLEADGLRADLSAAIARRGDPALRLAERLDPEATPLATAILPAGARPPRLPPIEQAVSAACDTGRFFGHRPRIERTGMPAPAWRRRWWDVLPEYGRYHAEFSDDQRAGEHDWYNVRPELVISPLLKSLVQPGFEMVPRVMGFPGVGPLHLKWIKCRYHFRADRFAEVWDRIVRATWSEPDMVDLMRRVRWSYDNLREVLALFPPTPEAARELTGDQIVALVTSWWPRWVEFFALNWFIQAQGDDIAYPFIEETVADNLARAGDGGDVAWPGASDFILPTTPVMSAEYMASVARVRQALLDGGLTSTGDALAALERGEQAELRRLVDGHLAAWGWMRDRDLLFEPWDTPARVIDTALKTEPHAVLPYQDNLRRSMFALGLHHDLARASGRAGGLAHAARFLHDLNVERENHHVLWLKYSYPLRRVVLEVERRLVDAGSLAPGDIFFLVAPELLDAARALPRPLPDELVRRVKNRRLGYQHEARLAPPGAPPAEREDDYY